MPPAAQPMRSPQVQPYASGPQAGFVPTTGANAKTMFVQAGPAQPMSPPQGQGMTMPAPTPGYPPPQSMASTLVPPAPHGMIQPQAMAMPAPARPAPFMAIPAAQPP